MHYVEGQMESTQREFWRQLRTRAEICGTMRSSCESAGVVSRGSGSNSAHMCHICCVVCLMRCASVLMRACAVCRVTPLYRSGGAAAQRKSNKRNSRVLQGMRRGCVGVLSGLCRGVALAHARGFDTSFVLGSLLPPINSHSKPPLPLTHH